MPKKLTCDQCGREDADEDDDGAVLCTLHGAEKDLASALDRYRDKRRWVRDVWFCQLVEMRQEIERLKALIVAEGVESKP